MFENYIIALQNSAKQINICRHFFVFNLFIRYMIHLRNVQNNFYSEFVLDVHAEKYFIRQLLFNK